MIVRFTKLKPISLVYLIVDVSEVTKVDITILVISSSMCGKCW